MKNKLFIQESDLEKILGALAEEAIKNSDKLRTHVTIGYDVFEGNYLRVDVSSAKTYQIILSKTYSIVSGLEKGDDVVEIWTSQVRCDTLPHRKNTRKAAGAESMN